MHRLAHALRRAALPVALALAAGACAPVSGRLELPAPATPVAPSPAPAPAPAPAPVPEVAVHEAPVALAEPAEAPAPVPPGLEVAPRARTRAIVLMYHLFGSQDSPLAVETAAFEEQLRWLAAHRVPVITLASLMSFLEGGIELPERVAVITLDDGHASVHARAYPLLKKYGVPFTLALNTEAIEGKRPEAVTWADVRDMLSSGLCEIASHSHIHGHMERLTDAMNRREAAQSRTILEARTGVRPEAFVYPFGGNDTRVQHIVEEAGYRAAFAVGGTAASAGSPRFRVPRVGVMRTTTLGAFARLFGEPARPPVMTASRPGAPRGGRS